MAEIINSLYLWACAQPAEFEEAAALNKYLTPSQNEKCKQLAKLVYFGWRKTGFWTLDRNLPCSDRLGIRNLGEDF
jgi:hypothetical protein